MGTVTVAPNVETTKNASVQAFCCGILYGINAILEIFLYLSTKEVEVVIRKANFHS
jgi:hypothetical protein